ETIRSNWQELLFSKSSATGVQRKKSTPATTASNANTNGCKSVDDPKVACLLEELSSSLADSTSTENTTTTMVPTAASTAATTASSTTVTKTDHTCSLPYYS